MKYYVYKYVREDGTPYYIGKGCNNRINEAHDVGMPPKERRVIIKDALTEAKAFEMEINLIKEYGRKDLGTGILRNLTDGGEGGSGVIQSLETRQKRSQSLKGKSRPKWVREKISEGLKGKPKSPEHVMKSKETNRKKPKVECPHCSRQLTRVGNNPERHISKCSKE